MRQERTLMGYRTMIVEMQKKRLNELNEMKKRMEEMASANPEEIKKISEEINYLNKSIFDEEVRELWDFRL
jgi:hypothetical protein